MSETKLEIELIHRDSICKSLRQILSEQDWDFLRNNAYKKANYKCEICGGVGMNHPVECHEIWKYDDKKRIQYIDSIQAICPRCHQVKHYALSILKGLRESAFLHLMRVNNWSQSETEAYIKKKYDEWAKRNNHVYQIVIKKLEDYGINLKKYQGKLAEETVSKTQKSLL